MALKKISQETFDEAVSTNIEDFGMEPDEALKSAIEEFTMQGFDLAGVIKTNGGTDLAKHEVTLSTQQLDAARMGSATADYPAAVLGRLRSLFTTSTDQETLQQNIAVALKAGTVPVLLRCVAQPAGSSTADCLRVLAAVVAAPETREVFTTERGPESVARLLEAGGHAEAVHVGLWDTAEAACTKDEENKCRFVEAGLGGRALQVLEEPTTSGQVAAAACRALKAVTTADDDRPPASKAFAHARQLGKAGSMATFHKLLTRLGGEDEAVAAAVLAALRQLAANDELCKEFTDAGGVACVLGLLRAHAGSGVLAAACCGALRQLANSDVVKKAVVEAGGLQLLLSVVTAHAGSAAVLEPALGLLTNLVLRNPEAAARAAEAGAVDVLLEVLAAGPRHGGVLRQACMAVRNMAVRNPELRPVFLERGAEALLRGAKATHPGPCRDVASAALRDLGLDNYQD